MLILLFLVVEHTVAKAFEIGIGNLIFEFPAHTLGIICFFSAARAVTACLFQSFFYGVDARLCRYFLKIKDNTVFAHVVKVPEISFVKIVGILVFVVPLTR